MSDLFLKTFSRAIRCAVFNICTLNFTLSLSMALGVIAGKSQDGSSYWTFDCAFITSLLLVHAYVTMVTNTIHKLYFNLKEYF